MRGYAVTPEESDCYAAEVVAPDVSVFVCEHLVLGARLRVGLGRRDATVALDVVVHRDHSSCGLAYFLSVSYHTQCV